MPDGRIVTMAITMNRTVKGTVPSIELFVTLPNGQPDQSVGPDGRMTQVVADSSPLTPFAGSLTASTLAFRCVLDQPAD